MNNVIELGNILPSKGQWKSRQCGRIYSVEGCSPTINTCGGGQREPKVLIEYT